MHISGLMLYFKNLIASWSESFHFHMQHAYFYNSLPLRHSTVEYTQLLKLTVKRLENVEHKNDISIEICGSHGGRSEEYLSFAGCLS
jgi:hypothetical protein